MLLFLFFISKNNFLHAQQRNTLDYIYDGGHLVLDIFKTVKKSKTDKSSNTTSKKETSKLDKEESSINKSSFCFENKSESSIYIELKRKMASGNYSTISYELTIASGETECSLGLLSGVYHYKIQDKTNEEKTKTIKEGDVLIDEKEDLVKEIK